MNKEQDIKQKDLESVDAGLVIGSLISSLENSFTKEQASAIGTALLYAIAFEDKIKEYWRRSREEILMYASEYLKGDNPGD